ncbi:MAG: hypothetical protein DMF91_07990 [Acidobacteria bacterium]|nr:MAG: hypothetical protein DMF91_07990 [Acidobacteriota bacterium]
MFVTRLTATLSVALTCGAAIQPPAGPDPALEQDDVAIIRAVVESAILPELRVARFGQQPIALLIGQTVKFCTPEERRLQSWRCLGDPRGLPRERKTETSFRVPDLNLPSVQLVTPDVVQRAFEGRPDEPNDGWEQLGRSFPGFRGVARFSAPAYVDDGAVVFVSFSCGSLCGKTWLLRLALRDGRWRVVDRKLLSMS